MGTYDYKGGKRSEYLERAERLYDAGSHFDCGALVEYDEEPEASYIAAFERLVLPSSMKLNFCVFGFEHGNASFVDFAVTRAECSGSGPDELPPIDRGYIFALCCSYAPMYVLGEVPATGGGGFIMPSLSAVDAFFGTRNRNISEAIAIHMKDQGFPRAYADELSCPFPARFGLESVMMGESPQVFDAYFNWND